MHTYVLPQAPCAPSSAHACVFLALPCPHAPPCVSPPAHGVFASKPRVTLTYGDEQNGEDTKHLQPPSLARDPKHAQPQHSLAPDAPVSLALLFLTATLPLCLSNRPQPMHRQYSRISEGIKLMVALKCPGHQARCGVTCSLTNARLWQLRPTCAIGHCVRALLLLPAATVGCCCYS